MSINQLRKEIQQLKKGKAPDYKTIEELLKVEDPDTLTDFELFRIIQKDIPELENEADLTDDYLEKILNEQ